MVSGRQPTGEDVAKRAGVSKSAVSRAFTGGSVSPEARSRIFEVARDLRYRPSQAARALKTNRSRLVGLAVTHLDNQFYPEVIEKVSAALAAVGSRIALFITHGEARLEPMVDELLGFSLDGVILASSSSAAEVARECRDAGMPVVMFNNVDVDGKLPGVSTDNHLGAMMVAEHLLDLGAKRLAIITGVPNSSASCERAAGFCQAIERAGLPAPLELNGNFSFEDAALAMTTILGLSESYDAVFCVNDHMALAAIEACRKVFVRPGQDIAIAGFDNVPIGAWPGYALTTYAQPLDQMIEACISRLNAEIAGKSAESTILRLPGELIVRASTVGRTR